MITLINDTLELWREAERVAESLPPTSPDHETALLLVARLRETFGRLTSAGEMTQEHLDRNRAAIEKSRALLRRIRQRSRADQG